MSDKWQWYWRTDENGHADCGVFYEKRPGHAYAVCRAPRYMRKEQWEEIAPVIASAPDLRDQRDRLRECLKEAKALLHEGYPGAAVNVITTALETINE